MQNRAGFLSHHCPVRTSWPGRWQTPIPNHRADDYGDGMNLHTTSALFSCDARLRDVRQQWTFPPVSQILQSCGKGRSSSCRSVRDLADTTKPGKGGGKISKAPPLLPGRGIIWLAPCRSRHWTNRSIEFFSSLLAIDCRTDGSACPISAFAFSLPPSR